MVTPRQEKMMTKSVLIECEAEHLSMLCKAYRGVMAADDDLPEAWRLHGLDAIINEMSKTTTRVLTLLGGE